MPVNIHGKQYVTVAERVAALHEEHRSDGSTISIATGIHSEDESQVTFWATVTVPTGTFWGHARSSKTDRSIEGQSPLEVAETSAVGRALGFAGYGVDESIASADEVNGAQRPNQTAQRGKGTLHEVKAPATRTVQQPAAYKGNWSKFWVLAKDKGMNKDEVHAYFGLAPEESLVTMAEMRAVEHKHSLQNEIDALTDVLRAQK